jgi:hypothetical protein
MAQQQTGGQTQIPQIGQSTLGTAPQQVGTPNGMWNKISQSANNFIGSGATLGEGNLFGTPARPGATQALRQNAQGVWEANPAHQQRQAMLATQGSKHTVAPATVASNYEDTSWQSPEMQQSVQNMNSGARHPAEQLRMQNELDAEMNALTRGNSSPPQAVLDGMAAAGTPWQGQQAPVAPAPVTAATAPATTEDVGLLDATTSVATPTTATPTTATPTTATTAPATTAPTDINTMAAEGIYAAGATTADELGFQEGQIATTDLDPYMNKYTQQVIEANEADILRGADKGMDMLGAQAQAANSFGGSRHGIAMGEMGRDVVGELAKSSAMLRKEGWDSATGLAKDDIMGRFEGSTQRMNAANQLGNISNLGFGMGQEVSDRLERQGTTQQALEQALIEAGKGQFDAYNNLPAETLAMLNAALGVTPYGQTQTDTKNPGLFDYLTLGASMK